MEKYYFGAGRLIAVPKYDADGVAIANPSPVLLGTLQEIEVELSAELKSLHGNKAFPVAIGRGKGKAGLKAKYGGINGEALARLYQGRTPTEGIRGAQMDVSATIPGSPYTVTAAPPSSGTFVANLGVLNATTGEPMTRVASAPATGQYTVNESTGAYVFAAADTGVAILYSYEYSAASGGLVYTLSNEVMGYTPSFSVLLKESSPTGQNLVVKFHNCVSNKFSMPFKNEDFAVQDFEAEIFAHPTLGIGYVSQY
jgi:hypothetical protein